MERHHRSILTLFAEAPFAIGMEVTLPDDAAHHVQVRRARAGEEVRLLDGRGRVATGALVAVGRHDVSVRVDAAVDVPRPTRLELIVPVADRDRTLLAAEKCVELQATAWRPVFFARSRGVGTRGEGPKFREKLRARMRSALEQSGGAWMPDVHEETALEDALHALDDVPARFVLDAGGGPLARESLAGAVAFATGPEGGVEPAELEAARAAGWSMASLGSTTLRFETAIIAAAAVTRARQFAEERI